jgi:hypothetical protein
MNNNVETLLLLHLVINNNQIQTDISRRVSKIEREREREEQKKQKETPEES